MEREFYYDEGRGKLNDAVIKGRFRMEDNAELDFDGIVETGNFRDEFNAAKDIGYTTE